MAALLTIALWGCAATPRQQHYELTVGMTKEQASQGRYSPDRVLKTTTRSGTRELWIYKWGMLHFDERGRLETIQKY